MQRRLSVFFILGMLLAYCGTSYAGDPINKLGRGIANCATGWVELPKEMMRETEGSGQAAGLIVAPLKGTAKAVGRTLAGVYDVVTFIMPLPRRYEPLIEPEFVF